MSEMMIEESKINLATLSVVLERATIEHITPNDKSLYVIEAGMFPFWIEIHTKPKYILFRTLQDFTSHTDELSRLSFCNRINSTIFMPSVVVGPVTRDNDSIVETMKAYYALHYREGLITNHFIRMCRNFSDGLLQVHESFDPNNHFLVPLGQEEQT